jgi:hypothetical protein
MFGLLGMLRGTVGTRDLGQRITRHRELSDNSLEVEYGSRQRSERAQGALVGLVPDTEARAVPGRSRGSREWSIRLRTELLSEVEYEEGLSFERSCTAVNISPIWVYPTVRRTPHRQSRYPRQSASPRNICMFHGWFGGSLLPEVMGLVSGEVYRLLSEDRCRLGCAAPRPTMRFRLQTLRISDLL